MKVKVCTYGNYAKTNRLEEVVAIIDLDSTDIKDFKFGADKHYGYGLEMYNTNIWNNLSFTGQCKIKSEVPYYDDEKFYVYILNESSTEYLDYCNNNRNKTIDNVANKMKNCAAVFKNYVEDGYDKMSYILQKTDDDKIRYIENIIRDKSKEFANNIKRNILNCSNLKPEKYNELTEKVNNIISDEFKTTIKNKTNKLTYELTDKAKQLLKNNNKFVTEANESLNKILNKINEKEDCGEDCKTGK